MEANSQLDWAWHGFDLTTTVHYLDGFHEYDNRGLIHYVKQTWFFDVQGSYKFSFSGPAEIWKRLLNRTTVTLGCNNVFGHDPPDANTSTNYADFTYDSTGRFVYINVSKEF